MTESRGRRRPSATEILEERARRLAKRVTRASEDQKGEDVLVFSIGRERFAIASPFVFAVFRLADLVPLPGARAPVVGVTRWRGDVLTVLDLRRIIGGAPGALDDLGRVVVVGQAAPEFGVLADSIDGITTIDVSALHPLRAERTSSGASLIRGVTQDAVHVLDASVLISRQTETVTVVHSAVSPSPTPLPQ